MSKTIARIVDMEKEIYLRNDRLSESKYAAYQIFDQIQTVSASLLTDRYIEGKPISQICEERLVTDRHLRRLMSEAINALQEVFDKA